MDKRKFFNSKDIIAITVVFILALGLYMGYGLYMGNNADYAEIIYDGQVIERLPLNKDTEYIPEINRNIIIEIKDEKIHFKHSDCPDKICINTGWLSKPGQTAVCLPNKISVVVKGKSSDGIDTAI